MSKGICKICRSTYEKKVRWQEVCENPDCKREMKTKRNKAWRKKNPEYGRQYMREYRQPRKKKIAKY